MIASILISSPTQINSQWVLNNVIRVPEIRVR